MSSTQSREMVTYGVVMNGDERDSICAAGRDVLLGRNRAGFTGSRAACPAYIDLVCTAGAAAAGEPTSGAESDALEDAT